MVNADNGDILASVRKTLKSENKANGTPKVTTITKVDIPSEDIHDTFTDDDSSREEEEEDEGSDSGVMASKKVRLNVENKQTNKQANLLRGNLSNKRIYVILKYRFLTSKWQANKHSIFILTYLLTYINFTLMHLRKT